MKITDCKYTKLIRISEKDLTWLKKNRGDYSMAGYLEIIINAYQNIPEIILDKQLKK